MIELVFPSEDRFRLSMMGMPVGGRVERSGSELKMFAESEMGMGKEELMKKEGAKAKDLDKPLLGSISEDGTTVTLHGEELGTGKMTFQRRTEKKEAVRESSVGDDEQGLVGRWKGKMTLPDTTDENERKMAEAMLSNIRLELRADNTFTLEMMFSMKGTWKVSAGHLEMTPTEAMGMTSGPGGQKIVRAVISGDGRTLKAVPDKGEREELTFTREP